MDGRFVHVVMPGVKKNLTFCEIYVYGSVLGKLDTLLHKNKNVFHLCLSYMETLRKDIVIHLLSLLSLH